LTVAATNENSTNKLFYEADAIIPAQGAWLVQIQIDGPAGEGTAAFPLEVEPAQTTNWFLLGGGGVVLVAALFAFFSWRRKG
jgi:LPXTG-motif cell wall-anchored protein